jgi:hypothetical protein
MVLALPGLFVAGLIVAAFRQGRSISLWPPKIGASPTTRRPRVMRSAGALHRPRDSARVDREYSVDRAGDFYQKIARNYDLRNSGNLGLTSAAAPAR